MTHVRSLTTSTPAAYSRAELERILVRYGCTRFGTDTDYEAQTLRVWFTVPDAKMGKGGEFIPVRLEVRLRDVAERIRAITKRTRGEVDPGQVERVAWRHLVLLVEAGLVAAEVGLKRVSEFFLADTVVRDEEGHQVRLVQLLTAQVPQYRALLGGGDSEK
jgi:hypothetical protein